MDKDALGSKKTKESKKKTESNTPLGASPLIFLLVVISVLVALLVIFKDTIFKKKTKNLDELVKKEKETKPEPEPETKPEVIEGAEKEIISEKFADLNN